MITPPPDMDADKFCLWIREQIAKKGAARFFGLNGYLVLYSGPLEQFRRELEKLLGRPIRDHKERGREEAEQHGTKILDDMPIGKWLLTQKLEPYFYNTCDGNDYFINLSIFKVWAAVSEELVKAAHGKAKVTPKVKTDFR